jgi:hypothetical protein
MLTYDEVGALEERVFAHKPVNGWGKIEAFEAASRTLSNLADLDPDLTDFGYVASVLYDLGVHPRNGQILIGQNWPGVVKRFDGRTYLGLLKLYDQANQDHDRPGVDLPATAKAIKRKSYKGLTYSALLDYTSPPWLIDSILAQRSVFFCTADARRAKRFARWIKACTLRPACRGAVIRFSNRASCTLFPKATLAV